MTGMGGHAPRLPAHQMKADPIADMQWGFFMVLWVLMLSRINKTNFKYSKKR